jgi:hypothetical protein
LHSQRFLTIVDSAAVRLAREREENPPENISLPNFGLKQPFSDWSGSFSKNTQYLSPEIVRWLPCLRSST